MDRHRHRRGRRRHADRGGAPGGRARRRQPGTCLPTRSRSSATSPRATTAWPRAATTALVAVIGLLVVVGARRWRAVRRAAGRPPHARRSRRQRTWAAAATSQPLEPHRRASRPRSASASIDPGLPIARTVAGGQHALPGLGGRVASTSGARAPARRRHARSRRSSRRPARSLATSNKRDVVDATRGPRGAARRGLGRSTRRALVDEPRRPGGGTR